jgi:multiple sugar transport system permease protein
MTPGAPVHRSTKAGWSFLVPFLLVYLLFVLYPVVQAIWMGFFERDLLTIDRRSWVGLDNYRRMFWGDGLTWQATTMWPWRLAGLALLIPAIRANRRGALSLRALLALSVAAIAVFVVAMGIHPGDEGRWSDSQFWPSFGNTLVFVILSTPTIVFAGLGLALLLNRPGRFVGLLRTLFFAPYVLSVAVLTLIWAFLLNPQLGLIGELWSWFGLDPVSWLNDPNLAMPTIVVVTLWWTVGFNVVLFLAGLQDIDQSQYEAASLDGANRWQIFRYITVPGLKRTTLLVVVLQIIASFQIFGQVFILTRGGPNGATRVSIQHIYESAFRDAELGYASAMSVFLFAVMMVVSAMQFRFMGGDES